MKSNILLADLKTGQEGIILRVKGRGAFRKRIIEMGFVRGKKVVVVKNAPLKDPIEYKIMDYYVSLRRSEAMLIEVGLGTAKDMSSDNNIAVHNLDPLLEQSQDVDVKQTHFTLPKWGRQKSGQSKQSPNKKTREKKRIDKLNTINVALVGNPNSGKTTLFNLLSGSRERVGNYGGVTVGSKEASLNALGYRFNLVDLPGTYSITEYTPEELYVRNYIFEQMPDVVINVLDSSNLERNLYLTTQLIDMDIKVVAALNMYDELGKKGDVFDFEQLGKMTGIPFVPTISTKAMGIEALLRKVIDVFEDREESTRHIHINYSSEIERSIKIIQDKIWIKENHELTDRISSRFLAIKLLEKDKPAEEIIFTSCANRTEVFQVAANEIDRLEQIMKEDSESIISNAKYAYITGALRETYNMAKRPAETRTDKIDNLLTHRFLGIPIFVFLMWLTFQLTFTLGEYPMQWIEWLVGALSGFVSSVMSAGPLHDLLTDGILAGIGSVIVYLPNILILFFIISFMEDTGYMARAAFIMDRLMHKIGLHGKSFIPMLVGFGCSVPAVMATRSIGSKNDRMLTMLIIPFMSCSAKLPVYLLFIGTFFSSSAATVLFCIYFFGIMMAAVSGFILKKIFFRKNDIPFVMELPPYRMPRFGATSMHMWEKGAEYLKKIGGIILIASIIVWALTKYPSDSENIVKHEADIKHIESEYEKSKSKINSSVYRSETFREQAIAELTDEKDAKINAILIKEKSEQIEQSYIGQIGKFIEPVMEPLGFDWRMSVSVVTGLAAKEVVVGTMGVLYHADIDLDDEENIAPLVSRIKNHTVQDGEHAGKLFFTTPVVLAFLAFVLLYFPCLATIVTIKREAGSWKWGIFAAFYTTAVAWFIAFLVYNIGSRLIG